MEGAREEWAALTSDAEYADTTIASLRPFCCAGSRSTRRKSATARSSSSASCSTSSICWRAQARRDFYARPLREHVARSSGRWRARRWSSAFCPVACWRCCARSTRRATLSSTALLCRSGPASLALTDMWGAAYARSSTSRATSVTRLAAAHRRPGAARPRRSLAGAPVAQMDAMPPGATRRFAVILGSGRRRPLEELLFHSGRARTSGYHCVADTLQEIATPGDAVERHEWEPVVQAYSRSRRSISGGPAGQELRAKPGAEESTTEQPLTRLYTYLLLEYGGLLEYYLPRRATHCCCGARASWHSLRSLRRVVRFFTLRSLGAETPPERKGEGASKKAQQREGKSRSAPRSMERASRACSWSCWFSPGGCFASGRAAGRASFSAERRRGGAGGGGAEAHREVAAQRLEERHGAARARQVRRAMRRIHFIFPLFHAPCLFLCSLFCSLSIYLRAGAPTLTRKGLMRSTARAAPHDGD